MGVRDTRIGGGGIGIGEVGAVLNDLQKEVAAAVQKQVDTTIVTVDLPSVDTSFAPIFDWNPEGGYEVTLAFFIPGYTFTLGIAFVYRSEVIDPDSYHGRRVEKVKDISDADRGAQRVERRLGELVKPSRTVDIVRLWATDEDGIRHDNPETDPKFADYPGNVLYTFVTPAAGAGGGIDSERPAAPAAPICTAFVDGNVKCEADVPASGTATIKKYRFSMATASTVPNRDVPSVGIGGLVALKKGHIGTVMFQRALSDITTITFFFRVQALNDIGWSEWSAATTVLGSTIRRPLEDSIDTGIPVLPMKLQNSGTATGSPAFPNDATHFTGADGDFEPYHTYLTQGKVLHLHVPSLAASDTIRRIISYLPDIRLFTVDVAFGSVPGNGLAYEVHVGNRLGEKSGTGHSTTVINLGAAGAALANNTLTGFGIYMPSQPSADKIRRITVHTGGQVTLESATAGALANNACYLICQGFYGYAAQNPLSGIIAAVPAQVWQDEGQTKNIIRPIMPTENGTSVYTISLKAYRKSNGVLKKEEIIIPSDTQGYSIDASSSYVPIYTIQFTNKFRDGESDGRSSVSFYFEGFQGGVAAPAAYDPTAFPAPDIGFLDRERWPIQFPNFS